MNKRSSGIWITLGSALLLAGCGQGGGATAVGSATAVGVATHASSLPSGVISASRACKLVMDKATPGFFTHPEQVHLVLTTYAKGLSAESGDKSSGMASQTLAWVVEVHAKAVNWAHSVPSGYKPPAQPSNDYSVVMNAKHGNVTDAGECRCWPLPLAKAGTVVSLSPKC